MGSGFTYSLNGGEFQPSNVFTNVATGNAHTITIKNSNGCTKTATAVTVNCSCADVPVLNMTSLSETVCDISKVTVSGNTYSNATGVKKVSETGGGTWNIVNVSAGVFNVEYTPHSSDVNGSATITISTDNAASCVSDVKTLTVMFCTCGTVTPTTISIPVNPQLMSKFPCVSPAISLSSAAGTDNQEVAVSNPITGITYTFAGVEQIDVSCLPPGVTAVWNNNLLTISGTPTKAGIYNYVIVGSGACGTPATKTGTIEVK